MSTAATISPRSPTSPKQRSYSLSPSNAQTLTDSDHCTVIPPPSSQSTSSSPTSLSASSIQRARSGSRTYSEVQAEERELARRRTRSRERGEKPEEALDPSNGQEGLSYGELKAEMETLLSLRRRSMSQPLTVDPDLPPSAPATSSPPPSRPKLSLTINTTNHHHHPDRNPGGGPVSPTAPSPAETGTLVRRKSSVSGGGKLPSEHPLPSPPPVPPVPSSPTTSFGSAGEAVQQSQIPSQSYNIIRSTSPSPTTTSQQQQQQQQQPPTQDLFWLPASLHPELAPQEFKAFIREQTRPEALARRTSLGHGSSSSSSSLSPSGGRIGRRSSMLRGEYKPRHNDGVLEPGQESTTTPPGGGGGGVIRRGSSLRRSGSLSSTGGGIMTNGLAFEELTIRDLQRLEELAAKAEQEQGGEGEGEGERLGRVLRRSLSLNPHRMAEGAAAAGAQLPESLDPSLSSSLPASWTSPSSASTTSSILEDPSSDYDSPLIVPPPGQILRRNARTKIRKTGPGGEVTFGYRSGPGGSRLGGGSRRGRSSSDGSGLVGVGSGPEDDTTSIGDHSVESVDTDDLRASTSSLISMTGAHQPPPRIVSSPSPPLSTGSIVPPIESPPLDGSAQHLEIAPPAPPIPHVEPPQQPSQPRRQTSIDESKLPPVAKPIVSEGPSSSASTTISPASAEYDWASQHLPQPTPTPPPPPPSAPIPPQYAVHPSHGPSAPPTPVAVPVPQPPPQSGRERSQSVSSTTSSKSSITGSSGGGKEKEKKSGWATRLGLGSSDEKKKKGKSKEKESSQPHHHQHEKNSSSISHVEEHSTTKEKEKEKEKESNKSKETTSSSLFGGLFGRKRNDYDSPSPPTTTNSNTTTSGTSPALQPPPPPTASGALLPNGRYANFYRLPIHVERAIYRLSHIKLANPRRPLYEQVLISNLMFWYLGLIQKPQPPPPAAPPVPIPGMRNLNQQQSSSNSSNNNSTSSSSSPNQSNSNGDSVTKEPTTPHKRIGLSKVNKQHSNSTGGGSGGNNVGGGSGGGGGSSTAQQRSSAEMPIKQASYENQGRELDQEQRMYHEQQQQQKIHNHHHRHSSPQHLNHLQQQQDSRGDRTSAPASMYPSPTSTSSHSDSYSKLPQGEEDDDQDEDDRPLGQQQRQHLRTNSKSPQRESYPPQIQPPVPVSTPSSQTLEPGFQVTSRQSHPPSTSTGGGIVGGGGGNEEAIKDNRMSIMSNKSLSEIYEAYSLTGTASGGGGGNIVEAEGEGEGGTTTTVAPPSRGSSLQALNHIHTTGDLSSSAAVENSEDAYSGYR